MGGKLINHGVSSAPAGKYVQSLALFLSTQLWTALMSLTIYVDALKTGRKLLSVRIVARREEEVETDGSGEAFHQKCLAAYDRNKTLLGEFAKNELRVVCLDVCTLCFIS